MHTPSRNPARISLGLLVALNLFNFIDRYILAAVEPSVRGTFFAPNAANAMWWSGTLSTAFVVSYMLSAPGLGWLADRYPRWGIIGVAAIIWSIATVASGLATTFAALFIARILVGIGEGAYGPAAPPIISDLFPMKSRSTMLAIFFAAVPTGAAFGYILGGLINVHMGWRAAFCIVSGPGLLLGLLCFFRKEPRTETSTGNRERASLSKYLQTVKVLLKRPSYRFNTAAQTALAFAAGGLAYWMPAYLQFRQQPASAIAVFGGIVACAGLISTLTGGLLADRLRPRLRGSDLFVSGVGMLLGFPFLAAMLFAPFPYAWIFLFCAVFFIYFNTGPANAATANISAPSVRAMAFALNLFVIHGLGDAVAPPLLGLLAGHSNMNTAFLAISAVMLVAGLLWLIGTKYLPADMDAVEAAEGAARAGASP
ncbi:MAG TPA: MFS transporter [Chthoniobacterales bacterium]|nr:MFS transporter [Chthoniobacterales bacterium]